MNFGDLQEEVIDRGFNHVPDERIKRWINQTYQSLADQFQWPWLEATTTGTAPLSIPDLRAVLAVVDTDNDAQLKWRDRRSIVREDPDVSDTGTPDWWYQQDATTIRVYPASTSITLSVQYLKVPSELTDDSDEPIIPERFHDLLVDGAAAKGYKDIRDFESAAALKAEFNEGVDQMRRALLNRNYDSAPTTVTSYPHVDA